MIGKSQMVRTLYFVAIGLVLVFLSGCQFEETGTMDKDGQACDQMAASSVTIYLEGPSGADLSEVVVTYSVDGSAFMQADNWGVDDQYVAGWEQTGTFVVRAELAGYQTAQDTATVGMDETDCHVDSQIVTLTLVTLQV